MTGLRSGPLGEDDDGDDRGAKGSGGGPDGLGAHVVDVGPWGDEYGALRPRRGTRMHRAFASARRDSAANTLTIAGAKSLDLVPLSHGGDVYTYLLQGGSRLTGSAEPARIADFQLASGDAVDSCAVGGGSVGDCAVGEADADVGGARAGGARAGSARDGCEGASRDGSGRDCGGRDGGGRDGGSHGRAPSKVPYRALTASLSAYDLSCRMREAAHAKSRLHAVETVATAETALAAVGVHGEDPAVIDDVLADHEAYTARERTAAALPSQLTHALVVDFDLTHNQARRHVIDAVIAYIGLSGSLRDVFAGVLSSEKLMVLVRRSAALSLADVRWLDRSARELDPDVPLETFARRVSELVDSRSNRRQKARNAFTTRRVEFERFDNGTACVSLHGPLTVLEPLMKRVHATAEAILAGRISPLDVTDIDGHPVSLAGLRVVDTRSLDQLVFDLLALVAPGTRVPVDSSEVFARGRASDEGVRPHCAAVDTCDGVDDHGCSDGTGCSAGPGGPDSSDCSAGPGYPDRPDSPDSPDVSGGSYGSRNRDHGWVRPSRGDSLPSEPADGTAPEFVIVRCPSEGDWLAEQARVSITVPVLTCIDADSLLPGEMEGHSPIPADLVRTILPTQSAVYRLLTDPMSGEVLEEVATTYRVPAGMRRTVEARHRSCAAPGCTRSSTKLDMDHIIPFDHAAPHNGGLTVPDNLHPLCEYHHQLKTAGIITVSVDDEGVERWSYPLGREAIAVIDSNFTEIEAAQQLLELLVDESRAAEAAATCSDVGCDRKGSTRHGGGGDVDDAQPPF